jgi:hypothetical protein
MTAALTALPHNRQLLEPNSVADGCNDDRGMSYFPKIRKPQPQSPQPLLGLLCPLRLWRSRRWLQNKKFDEFAKIHGCTN